MLGEIGIPATVRKEDIISLSLQNEQLKEHRARIKEIMQEAIKLFS